MAEFLNTDAINDRLTNVIINQANKRLLIITPFLRIADRIKGHLKEVDRRRIDIHVIYKKIHDEEKKWLESTSIKTSSCETLHAKCYLNENAALLTSMNLYEFSQVNNYEMGLLVSRDKDPGLYGKILEESERIEKVSEKIHVPIARVKPADDVPAPSRQRRERATVGIPKSGYCIRCKAGIPADPLRPYCGGCFATWNRYKKLDYEEKYCHMCSNESTASMEKPLCLSCYRKYKDVFEFAGS